MKQVNSLNFWLQIILAVSCILSIRIRYAFMSLVITEGATRELRSQLCFSMEPHNINTELSILSHIQ